jgi:hypothetical protein
MYSIAWSEESKWHALGFALCTIAWTLRLALYLVAPALNVLGGVFSHLPEILLDRFAGNVAHFLNVDRYHLRVRTQSICCSLVRSVVNRHACPMKKGLKVSAC